jgi:hypothetical protein
MGLCSFLDATHHATNYTFDSQGKMVWLTAKPPAALLQNAQIIRDWPEEKLPGDAVGEHHLVAHPKPPLTMGKQTRRPQPAAIWGGRLVHLGPETLRQRKFHADLP